MVKERFVIDCKEYHNLLKMLISPDEENIVVALTCIEQSEWRKSALYILLLMYAQEKKSKLCTWEIEGLWAKHAFKTSKLIELTGFPSGDEEQILIRYLKAAKYPAIPTKIFEDLLADQYLAYEFMSSKLSTLVELTVKIKR